MSSKPTFLSVPKAAKELNVSAALLRKEIKSGSFPYITVGGVIRISAAYIDQLKSKATGEQAVT